MAFGFLGTAAKHLALGQRQVLQDRQMRKQLEILKHHSDLGPQLGKVGRPRADVDFADLDRARIKWLEPVDAS